VGKIGPWDGIASASVDQGWTFFTGRGNATRDFGTPTARAQILLLDRTSESVVQHAIAWFIPSRGAEEYGFDMCRFLPPESINDRVVGGFSDIDAKRTQQVLIGLGPDWFLRFINRRRMMPILRAYDPQSSEWEPKFRQALLEEGFDVALLGEPSMAR
jgi:hypothetical protein